MSRALETADSSPDLHFTCDHCGVHLVIDRSAAGMTLPCQNCGQPTAVPIPDAPETDQAAGDNVEDKAAELRRRLKENESQRTEITGYINQLNIQLHRWQLRLQTLNERNQELKDEISGLAAVGKNSSA